MSLVKTTLLLYSLASVVSCLPSPSPSPAGASTTSRSLVVRVRLENGSIDKLQVDSDDMSFNQILQHYSRPSDATILVGNEIVDDDSASLSSLGLKNGTMITIRRGVARANETVTAPHVSKGSKPSFATPTEVFQPFPELAKNVQSAIRARSRRRSSGVSSYADLANIQSSLHVVEPQPKGRIQRVYMCATSAARFHSSCIAALSGSNRVGLLLGTIQSERLELKPPKARTSLSSMPSAQDYCQVAKVHALWEPPQQSVSGQPYDASSLLKRDDSFQRVLKVATYLGLQPIGWIFTYSENRHDVEADGLPVWAQDVKTGSLLQIEEMKERQFEGAKFATLAMSAATGATEAFQISDVAVQMVSEGMLLHKPGRIVSTQYAVIVDGREAKSIDTVLCLVNTALLSHKGTYSGDSAKKSTKKNGSLTAKAKKAILQAIDNDSALLSLFSDFDILLALDMMLLPQEMQDLCSVLQKWTRGQKQGSQVSAMLKRKLKSVLHS